MTVFSTTGHWWSPVNRIFHYWVLVVFEISGFCIVKVLFAGKKNIFRNIIDIAAVAAAIASVMEEEASAIAVPIQCDPIEEEATAANSFSSKYGNITTAASGGRNVYIVGHSCQSWHHSCQIWHHSWLTPLVMPDLALVMPGLALVTYNIHYRPPAVAKVSHYPWVLNRV